MGYAVMGGLVAALVLAMLVLVTTTAKDRKRRRKRALSMPSRGSGTDINWGSASWGHRQETYGGSVDDGGGGGGD